VVLAFAPPPEPGGPPAGWETLTFKKAPRATRYTIHREGEGWVLRAAARGSASGLYHPLDLDPRVHRILTWRWKVERVLERADPRRKEGDDYAARIYVAFRYEPETATFWERTTYGIYRALYGRYPPRAAITYVWDGRLPAGTALPNPYTDRTRMLVVRSGPGEAGRWVAERRDIYADYRRLFGGEPPRLAGIGLMTDTDDTGEDAVAWYGPLGLAAGD
jgi:hypothetical protein